MSGRYRPSPVKNFPPLLRRLARAAQAECPPGQADALVAFIASALRKESSDGTLVARATSELDPAIQAIARAHVEVDQALAAWRRALTAAADSPKQEDAASFCAGLAYGLAFAGR